jgi:hypothetical protein
VRASALTADLVTGAAFAGGTAVEVLDAVPDTLGTDVPIDAKPVAGIEMRLSLPAMVVGVVADVV